MSETNNHVVQAAKPAPDPANIPACEKAGPAARATWQPVPLPSWLRELYPFAQHTFTTPGGARMNYVDEGPANAATTGPATADTASTADTADTTAAANAATAAAGEAVLMLHGNPTWSFFYRDIIRALSPSIRCIAPDHIGMGLSEKPPAPASASDGKNPYTLAARIDDIEALVAALGLKRIHLVVHDWGGAIGFGLATRHPEKIGRIVILNTAAFPDSRIPARIALCRAPLGIGALIVRGFNGFAWPATWMAMHRRKLTPAEKRGCLHPYDNWRNRVAVHEFVRDIPMTPSHPTRATLAEIHRRLPLLAANPKLILWGGRDFCFNDHFYNRWREIYPDAAAHHFPDAGHYLLDDGGDEVRAEIVNFLTATKP